MAKRYIGIELDGRTARLALLTEEGGDLKLDLRKDEYATPEEARLVLADLTGGARPLGDHLVAALPAGSGFTRCLRFPFKERSKLEAVLLSELDSQVPTSLDNHTCAMQPPRELEEGYAVDAAAVSNDAIEALLEHFPDPAQHPRRIGLLPHGLAAGLAEKDGLLVYCGRQETEVALIADGRVIEFRLLPASDGIGEEERVRFVLTQLLQLERIAGSRDLPLWVCGSEVSESFLSSLREAGREAADPEISFSDQEISAEFIPAVLLAQAEKKATKQGGFNFRTGSYAPRGQLEMMKKKLVAAAVLLVLCLLVLGGTGYFNYQSKATQASLLKQQLEDVYRQTIPNAKTIVDVPLQMQSHLKELKQQALLLGVGGRVTALSSLEALSSLIGRDIKNDLKEMTYSGDQIKLDGYTDSFDSVNRITQAIGKSPLFGNVEISEAKMAANGGRVDFQLQIELSKMGGAQ